MSVRLSLTLNQLDREHIWKNCQGVGESDGELKLFPVG